MSIAARLPAGPLIRSYPTESALISLRGCKNRRSFGAKLNTACRLVRGDIPGVRPRSNTRHRKLRDGPSAVVTLCRSTRCHRSAPSLAERLEGTGNHYARADLA